MVSFCNVASPSVLDRLNALVEPDGVLYIDERGVVGGGGVMAIHPHPNFRCILYPRTCVYHYYHALYLGCFW